MSSSITVKVGDTDQFTVIDARDLSLVALGCSLSEHGYVRVRLKSGGSDYLHRVILGRPATTVDHIDGNKLNNRRNNLRVATLAQNLWNRGKASHNKSGYKGVYFCKSTRRYRAEIRANNKCIKIGRFDTAEEAAMAYDRMAIELHGEFSRINFPRDFVTVTPGGNTTGPGCGE